MNSCAYFNIWISSNYSRIEPRWPEMSPQWVTWLINSISKETAPVSRVTLHDLPNRATQRAAKCWWSIWYQRWCTWGTLCPSSICMLALKSPPSLGHRCTNNRMGMDTLGRRWHLHWVMESVPRERHSCSAKVDIAFLFRTKLEGQWQKNIKLLHSKWRFSIRSHFIKLLFIVSVICGDRFTDLSKWYSNATFLCKIYLHLSTIIYYLQYI